LTKVRSAGRAGPRIRWIIARPRHLEWYRSRVLCRMKDSGCRPCSLLAGPFRPRSVFKIRIRRVNFPVSSAYPHPEHTRRADRIDCAREIRAVCASESQKSASQEKSSRRRQVLAGGMSRESSPCGDESGRRAGALLAAASSASAVSDLAAA